MKNAGPPRMTSPRWGSRTKRTVVIGALIALGFIVWNLKEVVPLLIVSTLLSYLLWPLMNFIERRVLFVFPFPTRTLAVLFTFVVVIAAFVVIIILIVPTLVNQITEVGGSLPEFIEETGAEIEELLSKPITLNGRPVLFNGEPIIPLERIEEITGEGEISNLIQSENIDFVQMLSALLGSVGSLSGPAFSIVGGAFDAVINVAFLIMIMFYLTRDGEKFAESFVGIIPESYRGDMRRLFYELGQIWDAYLRGQLVLSVSVGVAVYVVALVLGLPNAPILGLLSGLLEFLPTLGPFLAMVPAVILALLTQSSTLPFLSGIPFALLVSVVWVGIQNVEAIFLVPRVMGSQLNLHPVVVIIAVITGANVAGIMGIVLAAPFTASIRLIGQYFYGKVFDTNPFPTMKADPDSPSPGIVIRAFQTAQRFALYIFRKAIMLRRPVAVSSATEAVDVSTIAKNEEEILF